MDTRQKPDLSQILNEYLEDKKSSSFDNSYTVRRKLERFQFSDDKVLQIMAEFELEWQNEQEFESQIIKARKMIKLTLVGFGTIAAITIFRFFYDDKFSNFLFIFFGILFPVIIAYSNINSVKMSREMRDAKWKNY